MKKDSRISKWTQSKKRLRFIGAGIFVLVFAVIGLTPPLSSFASGENIYISPTPVSVQPGKDFTVTLRMNGGSGVNVIDATIDFDQTKLQYKSIDTTASAFNADGPQSVVGGRINLVRGNIGGLLTGDFEVAKITFTAMSKVSGNTTLALSGSAADNDLDNAEITLGTTNGVIKFTKSNSKPKPQTFYLPEF